MVNIGAEDAISYFSEKEKVKRKSIFKTPVPLTDTHEVSQEIKCLWFQSSKTIRSYLQPMEKKNYQLLSKIWKDVELK